MKRITYVGRIENGWWMIKARLFYNGKIHPREIDFLIDSGAEKTILCDQDAKRLGYGFDALVDAAEVEISGSVSCKGRPLLNAGIVFSEKDGIKNHIEPCHMICVLDPKTTNIRCNLIGQDILTQYNVITNNKQQTVILKRIKIFIQLYNIQDFLHLKSDVCT